MINQKKIILVFTGGSKGDLLRNFLCDEVEYGLNKRNESKGDLSLRMLDMLFSLREIDYLATEAKKFIKCSKDLILTSHTLCEFPLSFFEEMKDYCFFLFLDIDGYENNVKIDVVLKRYNREIVKIKRLLAYSKGYKSKDIKYFRDIEMLDAGYQLNNLSRISFIKKKLSEEFSIKPLPKDKLSYFKIVKYKDIFFPPFTGLKEIALMIEKDVDLEYWKNCVQESYLPKKVDVFGEIVYPADYGYVWHYEKDIG